MSAEIKTTSPALGSALLGDDEFLYSVETCQYALADFHHGDHLRLAWLYVRRHPLREALALAR